jgi:hypothetical protein
LNEAPQPLPSPGDVLTNEEISRRFAVGNMGGMRRSKKRSLLVIIMILLRLASKSLGR